MSLDDNKISRRGFLAAAGKALSVAGLATAGLSLDSEDVEAASVRVKRVPNVGRDGIKTFAAVQSVRGNGIVITAYGDDADFHSRIIDGAIEAAGQGYPIVGVIIGDAKYESEGEVYMGGRPWVTLFDNISPDRAKEEIEYAFKEHQRVSLENNDRQPT